LYNVRIYCLSTEKQFNIVNKPPSCPENFQICNEEVDDANDGCNEVTMSQGMLSI